MSELKRCPFCGGKADVYRDILSSYRVACLKVVECSGGQVRWFESKGEAIEAWNKRA